MALTPNYSWPTPDNTDLVKDGAEAIRDLGNAIDNTVNSLPSGGLVHINSTSFSAVASQSINDVFSTTYDNYRLLFKLQGSTNLNLSLRLRVGGVDNSSSVYHSQGVEIVGGSVASMNLGGGSNRLTLANMGSSNLTGISGDMISPFASEQTRYTSTGFSSRDGNLQAFSQSGLLDVTTSYTGFTLLTSTGNITGTVSIYGYAKA